MTTTSILWQRAFDAFGRLYERHGWQRASAMWRRFDEWMKWQGRA